MIASILIYIRTRDGQVFPNDVNKRVRKIHTTELEEQVVVENFGYVYEDGGHVAANRSMDVIFREVFR